MAYKPGKSGDTHAHGYAPHTRLFALLRPERSDIGIIIFFSIITGLLYLATPLAVDAVVQNIAFGGQQKVYLQTLLIFSFALLVFLVLLSMISAAQHYVAEIIQQRIFVRLASDMAYRLPRLRMDAFESYKTPELVNRFLDVTTLQKSSAIILLDGVNVILSSLIGLLVLAFYHPFLLAFDLALVVLLGIIVVFLGRRGVQTSINESGAKHSVAGWFEQMVMYPILFKGPGGPQVSVNKANVLVNEYLTTRKAHYQILIRQIIGLLGLQAMASASLLAMGGALVLGGELTLGQLVASELILSAIFASIVGLGKHIEIWYDAMAATDKLGTLVDLTIENQEGEDVEIGDGPISVECRNLSFGFASSKNLFHDLNLQVKPGEKLAITGPIGVGAGTLLQVIYGLRDTHQGAVFINQIDIRHYKLEVFRMHVVLANELGIFEGSIIENIRMDRESISLEDVYRTLEDVGLYDYLLGLPEGLDTRLHAGGRPLSDSQRIKLVMARAMVSRPRLILVDKVLDGLDPVESRRLYESLFVKEAPWTLILASRDRNLLERCDRIVRLTGPVTNSTKTKND